MSKDLLTDIIYAIREEMQHSIMVCSWADYAEEHGLTRPQTDFADTMPEAIPVDFRTECYNLGERMYEAVKAAWIKETSNPHVEPWACLFAWVINNNELDSFDKHLKRWAHDAVMSCIGSGAFWEDSHTALQARKLDGELVEVEIRHQLFEVPMWEGGDD